LKSTKSEGRDKGRRKGEKTGGDRQLREGTEERVKGREGGEKKRRPKALPATQNKS